MDTKKKELVGDFKNQGREWRPKGTPEAVQVHDFIDPKLGRAVPYGVYDLADNKGWVSVGTDHDTASFAVHAIKRWWRTMGRARYPKATRLLITADGGGSNGYRVRLWKIELQTLANSLRIPITVCHLPPGTSKWNKIEHRLFSFITLNWRGKPLRSFKTIVQLIAATTTKTGLRVRAELDEHKYPKGVKISAARIAAINLRCHEFHGEWNYTIDPRRSTNEAVIYAQISLTDYRSSLRNRPIPDSVEVSELGSEHEINSSADSQMELTIAECESIITQTAHSWSGLYLYHSPHGV